MNKEEQIIFLRSLLEKAKKDKIEKFVVGAVIQDKDQVLLLKRPAEDFMGGINELPSGNMEEGEELFEALIREVKEETNLDLKQIKKYLGTFDYLSGSGKSARQFNFLINVEEKGEIKLTEHDEHYWANEGHEAFEKVTDSVKEVLKKI
ncbi:NUDIX domain-containing protein [Candidatus Pacearchaeota archaeon]|nr:NUDIX domain-containing protein [Candidatus Pacearchaeota archaeon]